MCTTQEWEELKTASIQELAERINLDLIAIKPPVFRSLEIMQTPQLLITAALKVSQSRVSLLQSGKKQLTIEQQERLCDIAEYLLDKCHAGLSGQDVVAQSELETIIDGDCNKRNHVRFQIEFAKQMLKIQRVAIVAEKSKQKGDRQNAA